ncbi:hypothetical protein H4219_005303 [Mycoemilia scoparia]|uniref:Uncharacterized protein n=1 Tax=Mycoemilia scoparia TaxID=417184 RepID=A0A9W7ZPL4_9FUNG|nr:hypothetical protein H4219_005303 [Mycoemilia scoparia]
MNRLRTTLNRDKTFSKNSHAPSSTAHMKGNSSESSNDGGGSGGGRTKNTRGTMRQMTTRSASFMRDDSKVDVNREDIMQKLKRGWEEQTKWLIELFRKKKSFGGHDDKGAVVADNDQLGDIHEDRTQSPAALANNDQLSDNHGDRTQSPTALTNNDQQPTGDSTNPHVDMPFDTEDNDYFCFYDIVASYVAIPKSHSEPNLLRHTNLSPRATTVRLRQGSHDSGPTINKRNSHTSYGSGGGFGHGRSDSLTDTLFSPPGDTLNMDTIGSEGGVAPSFADGIAIVEDISESNPRESVIDPAQLIMDEKVVGIKPVEDKDIDHINVVETAVVKYQPGPAILQLSESGVEEQDATDLDAAWVPTNRYGRLFAGQHVLDTTLVRIEQPNAQSTILDYPQGSLISPPPLSLDSEVSPRQLQPLQNMVQMTVIDPPFAQRYESIEVLQASSEAWEWSGQDGPGMQIYDIDMDAFPKPPPISSAPIVLESAPFDSSPSTLPAIPTRSSSRGLHTQPLTIYDRRTCAPTTLHLGDLPPPLKTFSHYRSNSVPPTPSWSTHNTMTPGSPSSVGSPFGSGTHTPMTPRSPLALVPRTQMPLSNDGGYGYL